MMKSDQEFKGVGGTFTTLGGIHGITGNSDAVDWPEEWDNCPVTAKEVGGTGVIGSAYMLPNGVVAARTEDRVYSSIALDTKLPKASFFARISAGTITDFFGGDFENYIYMTGGSIGTLYGGVNSGANTKNIIQIDGGTVGTLYGGGNSGATIASTTISGGTFTNVYGGAAERYGYTGTAVLNIAGGTFQRLRCAGDSGTSVGNVIANITGGTFIGQICGGGLGWTTNITLNIDIASSTPTGAYIYGGSMNANTPGYVTLNITRGVYQGLIVAASRASGDLGSIAIGGPITLNISGPTSHISNPKAIAAGVDTAWIFAAQAMDGGTFNGDVVNMSITGGASVKYLVGGAAADGLYSFASVNNVFIKVAGATVTGGIWGAGYAHDNGRALAQKVRIVIDSSDSVNDTTITGNINTGGILLGGKWVEYYSGKVIFTGSGSNLNFCKTVDGSGAPRTSTLEFCGFTDSFNGTITNFDRVVLSGNTSVNIGNAYSNCSELIFDLRSRQPRNEDTVVTSMDSFQFAPEAERCIGLLIDTQATGEVYTELMKVSDIFLLEGVKIELMDDYEDKRFSHKFDIGGSYSCDDYELIVDYDSASGMLYSLFVSLDFAPSSTVAMGQLN